MSNACSDLASYRMNQAVQCVKSAKVLTEIMMIIMLFPKKMFLNR